MKKSNKLLVTLAGFFICNALVAEFIGVKIFALEDTFGWQPMNWNLFGEEGSLQFTAGVLLWPIVFIMTDVINEYFGQKGVRVLSFLAAALISYAFLMVYLAIGLAPADWWVGSSSEQGVPDMQAAYRNIFGQSNWIIVGSLVAFLVGQLVDAWVFHKVRARMGEKAIWIRATLSTVVSQLIDSYIVLYIAFVIGPQQWPMNRFFAIGTVNYGYKVLMAILLIPMLYLVHYIIDNYLGKAEAERLRKEAFN
ncbi:MAG: queuosine precursor transporter [Saprospiraceae bacterium]